MYLEDLPDHKFILGSSSPRRQALLGNLNIEFDIQTLDFDESAPDDPDKTRHPEIISRRKSNELGTLADKECLITSDTSVVLGDRILNKPADAEEARQMLSEMSGKWHEVYTGVCLRNASGMRSFTEMTRVHFKDLRPELIDYYIDTYKPYDKAGSYGIQEWFGYLAVDRIEGCFFNVMGLPLSRLHEEMLDFLSILPKE